MDKKTMTAEAEEANRIIDYLGGNKCVAEMFDPPISSAAISQWREGGIPNQRLQLLRLTHPDAFSATEAQS